MSYIADLKEMDKKMAELLSPTPNYKLEILKYENLQYAHAYCKCNCLNGQKSGPLIEYYIQKKFNMEKNKASDCNGDCKDQFGKNVEVKISLGSEKNKINQFNYVQLRPNHEKIDNYILTGYHLTKDNIKSRGELYIFKITKEDLKLLILEFGSYSHGTKKEHGPITAESLKRSDNKCEYSLRPVYGKELWEKLLKFRIQECSL